MSEEPGMNDVEFAMETRDSTGDTLSLTSYQGQVRLCIEEPWAGDTESGFGRECSAYLNREQVIALRDALNEVLGNASAPVAPPSEE